MQKHYYLLLITSLMFILQSCHTGFYPPMNRNPLGPRMIQPIPNNGSVNALAQDPNFVQSYPRYKKSKTDSKFGALVRIIEFEYDISDTFSIIPRITSGFDEGEMTGVLTIMLDQYELIYENKSPQVREYVEEVSYETTVPRSRNQQVVNPASTDVIVNPDGTHSTIVRPSTISTIQNSVKEKHNKVVKRSQLYNSAKFRIENEDVGLFLRSDKISYFIHLQNTMLMIVPSNEQIKILKKMILLHYGKKE